jgi:hypothetical protein
VESLPTRIDGWIKVLNQHTSSSPEGLRLTPEAIGGLATLLTNMQQVFSDLYGARMILEARARVAGDCLAMPEWKPDCVHIQGMRSAMVEALDHLRPHTPAVVDINSELPSNPPMVEVQKIQTVTGYFSEPGTPFWRIEIGGYCADFDYEQAAQNFATAINTLVKAVG